MTLEPKISKKKSCCKCFGFRQNDTDDADIENSPNQDAVTEIIRVSKVTKALINDPE